MMAKQAEIIAQTETIEQFAGDRDEGMFRRFIGVLQRELDRLTQNEFTLRSFWQPGDIKFSLRQKQDPMPGFEFCGSLALRKEDNPELYKVVGDRDVATPVDGMFHLPDFTDRFVKVVGAQEKAGNHDTVDIEDASPTGSIDTITLTAWVKT